MLWRVCLVWGLGPRHWSWWLVWPSNLFTFLSPEGTVLGWAEPGVEVVAALLILSVLVPSLPLSPPSSAALSILGALVAFLLSPAMSLFPSDLITLLPLADFGPSVDWADFLSSEDLVAGLLPSLAPLELSFPLVFPSDLEPPFFPSELDLSFLSLELLALLFPLDWVFPPWVFPPWVFSPWVFPPWVFPPWAFPPWLFPPWAFSPLLLPPFLLAPVPWPTVTLIQSSWAPRLNIH